MMPAGVPPILLFRTFARNVPMASAMGGWGSYELGRQLSLGRREREILIDRTCARCGCEYEFRVHVAFFAARVGLDAAQIESLATGDAADACWTDERERNLIRAADSLHERADLGDDLWDALRLDFTDEQLLDLLMLCGWYHAIAYVANGARVAPEPTIADSRLTAAG
jgi:alkylhydroperoxidase family enzyme